MHNQEKTRRSLGQFSLQSSRQCPHCSKYRRLLSLLFKFAAQTISAWLYEMNRSLNYTTGIVCALHTFDHDLKWNPHIHMIIAEGVLDCSGKWKNINYFPYTMLRKRRMTTLLSNLKSNGFYVQAPGTELGCTDVIVNYVTRYIGRPAMA